MADIRELAEQFVPLSTGQIESFLLNCVDAGEDHTVSRILQVCAFNEVTLDPTVLCQCIGVCEEMLDSAPCFAHQDERVVESLLGVSVDEALSQERKLYAARLAAELTVKFGLDPQPVRKLLWKHEQSVLLPHHQLLIAESLQLLDQDSNSSHPPPRCWSDFQLTDILPEHKPHAIIGGSYTVRRPIPKLGRNDSCHCGSGKKYKKCCYAKDQELLRDASQYAGVTKSELKNKPGLIDDPAIIYNMRAYELKRLKPAELSPSQLLTGYQCALDYGLRELAFEMLVECERRNALPDFDHGHFEDLIERVLDAGDLSLARKIRDHCGEDGWYRPHAIQFRFDLLENPERFAPLEHDCRKSVCGILDEETESDEPLIRLAYDCVSRYPALAMVFARAAIVSNPERHFDNEVLLDLIRDARVDLDLDPGSDPVESLFDWIENQTELKAKTKAENQEIKRLSDQLAAAREALSDKKQALRDQEHMLEEAGKQLEKALEPDLKATIQAQALEHSGDPNQEEAVQRLRLQVVNLKAEIGEQQAQRRQLRRQLQEERQKLSASATLVTQQEQASRDEGAERVGPSGRPILPDYTEAFRKTCATLSPTLVAKAILAAGRFAAQDPVIWQQTKTIQRLPEHYRIRINPDYRMIVHWLPGQSLFILDVIPRQDLESWIKRHR